jgi:hypothetical protein
VRGGPPPSPHIVIAQWPQHDIEPRLTRNGFTHVHAIIEIHARRQLKDRGAKSKPLLSHGLRHTSRFEWSPGGDEYPGLRVHGAQPGPRVIAYDDDEDEDEPPAKRRRKEAAPKLARLWHVPQPVAAAPRGGGGPRRQQPVAGKKGKGRGKKKGRGGGRKKGKGGGGGKGGRRGKRKGSGKSNNPAGRTPRCLLLGKAAALKVARDVARHGGSRIELRVYLRWCGVKAPTSCRTIAERLARRWHGSQIPMILNSFCEKSRKPP